MRYNLTLPFRGVPELLGIIELSEIFVNSRPFVEFQSGLVLNGRQHRSKKVVLGGSTVSQDITRGYMTIELEVPRKGRG